MLNRIVSICLTCFVCLMTSALAAKDTDYRFVFEAYYSGFKIGEAAGRLQWSNDRYALDLSARTAGVLGWVMSIDQQASSNGHIDTLPTAEWHRNHNADGDNRNWIELAFTADDIQIVDAHPHPETETRSPVPADMKRGALDPLSAVLALGVTVTEAGQCSGTVPVFDGRRRYDTVLDHVAREPYTGPAGPKDTLRCNFHFVRLGGYRPDAKRWKGISGTAWLQQVADGLPMLPVRVEVETSYGKAFVHMVSASPAP